MSYVEPAKPRSRVRETLDGLEVEIPLRASGLVMWTLALQLVLPIVGAVVFFGFVFSTFPLQPGEIFQSIPLPFLLVFVGFLVFGLGPNGYFLLRSLIGREVLEVSRERVRLRTEVGPFKRARDYAADEVKDLRAVPGRPMQYGARWGRRGWPVDTGTLAFDYGAKTVRFAPTTDEAESRQIVSAVLSRFPNLGRPEVA